jgi:hypothetical protein
MGKISPALEEKIKRTRRQGLVGIVISTKFNGFNGGVKGNRVEMVKDYLKEIDARDIYGTSTCELVSATLPRYLIRHLAAQPYVSWIYSAKERIDVLKGIDNN